MNFFLTKRLVWGWRHIRLIYSNRSSTMVPNIGTQDDKFKGISDKFKCITVSSDTEECEASVLLERLDQSLKKWQNEGVRGVWFRVHPNQADWVPILVKQGFVFHHAKADCLALYLWLDKEEPDQIPSYAHTLVGVGGMVVNDSDEVLVVQERFYLAPHWKLPGGYVDPGEEIHQAAVREVLEETGVQTEFRSIVAFRHAHKYNFGCSDLYIIVGLKPVSTEIRKCNREISDCKWMPIQEYLNHELVHDLNREIMKSYLTARENNASIGLTQVQLKMKDFVRSQSMYAPKFQEKKT